MTRPFYFLLFFCLCALTTGCKQKTETKTKLSLESAFEELMGKGEERWSFIQTPEDFENLEFFKSVYQAHVSFLKNPQQKMRVPKVLHFIWIGPKPFPLASVENVRTWVAHHPDWKIKFWTDRDRPLPHPAMERVLIKDFPFEQLGPFYLASDNYGEKSDLLRLEILNKEGGIYIDHDVKCFKSFDLLGAAFDFYCGMELPYKTCLSSSVLPTNNLIGSIPGHPILKASMDWLAENWERIEKDYPGKDRDSLINRVAHRTFFALGYSFKRCANNDGYRDVALPAYFFNAPDDARALYARHQYAGQWFENESEFEKMARKRLMTLSKKSNQLLLLIAVLGGLQLATFSFLMLRRASPKR